jgi:hypothetical protein
VNVVDLTASGDFTCALTLDNEVYCWGRWVSSDILEMATLLPF